MEQQVSELISGMASTPVEESPYEALFEASSCHSLDSLASGKSSDRDSGRPDSEAGKVSIWYTSISVFKIFVGWNKPIKHRVQIFNFHVFEIVLSILFVRNMLANEEM